MSEPGPTAWARPPDGLKLGGGEVHLWLVSLEIATGMDARRALLSGDELARADAFHFDRHRHRFVAARSALRRILGHYTGREPEGLRFSYGPHGKPSLEPGSDDRGLRFNLSHSHTLALVGVTQQREIGVDIERVRPTYDIDKTIARFFSERENQAFRALGRTRWPREFFRCWSRKEAFLKARGHGFFHSTRGFSVSVDPDEPARLIEIAGEPGEAARWTLHDLEPAPGYAAALVIEGAVRSVGTFRFSF